MDTLSPIQRSERMRRIRGKDTKPEIRLRKLIHGMGYRYRLHGRDLPGVPDLVFRSRKMVIFLHGCFWHRHPDPACKLARLPKSRLDFWEPKLTTNAWRDECNNNRLAALGWRILTVWECELNGQEKLKNRIRGFLETP